MAAQEAADVEPARPLRGRHRCAWESRRRPRCRGHVRAARTRRPGSAPPPSSPSWATSTPPSTPSRPAGRRPRTPSERADELYRRTRRWAADAFAAAFLCLSGWRPTGPTTSSPSGRRCRTPPTARCSREPFALTLLQLGHGRRGRRPRRGGPCSSTRGSTLPSWPPRPTSGPPSTTGPRPPSCPTCGRSPGRWPARAPAPRSATSTWPWPRIHHLPATTRPPARHVDALGRPARADRPQALAGPIARPPGRAPDEPADHDRALAIARHLDLPLLLRML